MPLPTRRPSSWRVENCAQGGTQLKWVLLMLKRLKPLGKSGAMSSAYRPAWQRWGNWASHAAYLCDPEALSFIRIATEIIEAPSSRRQID